MWIDDGPSAISATCLGARIVLDSRLHEREVSFHLPNLLFIINQSNSIIYGGSRGSFV
jgi:hypothetical protein